MTETYDTTIDSTTPFPLGNPGGRTIEAIDHGGGYFYVMVYMDTNYELIYAYGDTNSWTTEALTGPTSITSWDTADVLDCALAVDHNNDYVHIVFMGDNKVFHMRLTDPDDPSTAGNWTTYGANKYQRVDNSTHSANGSVSICVDDSTGAANGNDYPHVAWCEDITTTPHVHYNVGSGASNAFNVGSDLSIDDGRDPTIININDEGRRLYLSFVDSTETRVDCIRHTGAGATTTLSNWSGPVFGIASTPDGILNLQPGHVSMERPTMSWYWDTDERVLFAAVSESLGGGGNAGKTRLFLDATTTLAPEHTVGGLSVVPFCIQCTQVLSSDFRLIVQGTGTVYEHAREAATAANDYEWDATSEWYQVATTSGDADWINAEWRGIEHADGALGYRRTHMVWLATDNLYFSELRENTPLINALVEPTNGTYKDESSTILIDWSNTDYESDGQDNYELEVDDDINFGSPTVDIAWGTPPITATSYTIGASTLTAEKIYYWRVRTRDAEQGDEYDPYSDEEWSTDLRWFVTTSQLDIEIDEVAQQTDGDVYIDLFLSSTGSHNAELDDGVTTDYAQYRTTGGSWTNMTIISGECTSAPTGPITTSPGGTFYRLAWDADTQISTYEGLVDIRVRGQYDGDSRSLGFTDWVQFDDVVVDNVGPVVAVGIPDGLTLVERSPMLYASGTDYHDFEYAFEVDDDSGFGSQLHQSGWQDEDYYRVPSSLSSGLWYFRAQGRDKSTPQNVGSWHSGSFTIAEGTFTGTLLSDGTNDIVLYIINEMRYIISNSVVEYNNITNDYDETATNQNIVEIRGRNPLEITMTLFFNSGFDAGGDLSRMFEWKKDGTKLSLEDVDGKLVTFGDSTYQSYEPNRWVILSITPQYNAARYNSIHATIVLREVEP